MKTGSTLDRVLEEAYRVFEAKEDLLVPSKVMTLTEQDNSHVLEIPGHGSYGLKELAHQQLATYTDIPKAFYDRIRSGYPDLLTVNVNRLLQSRKNTDLRTLRTLDGDVRAILSNGYRIRDNWDLLKAILPVLTAVPGFEIAACEVTDTRLFIKVTSARIRGDVRVGDTVQMGLIITNSEVGLGSVSIKPYTVRLVCLNGAVHEIFGRRYNHTGARLQFGGDPNDANPDYTLFSDETMRLSDAAFFAQVSDVIRATFTQETFETIIADYRKAAGVHMGEDPIAEVKVIANRFDLNLDQEKAILNNLMKSGDLTQYGVGNAITRRAEDEGTMEEATKLERIGGAVLLSNYRELVPADRAVRSNN